MSYNIERGAGGIEALTRAIRAQKPDIICLQESQGVYRGRRFEPGAQIAARFPGWSGAHSGDVMTLSRFPLVSQSDFPLRGTRRILQTTFQTSQGRLQILNLHVATSVANKNSGIRHGRLRRIIEHAQPAAQARLDQIAPIRRAMAGVDQRAPLVVAGDFNSPPRGRFYGAISRGFADAWSSAGLGTGLTFPSRFPLLPIDHVLVRGTQIDRAFVPDVRVSDHRPMVVDMRLAKMQNERTTP